MARIVKPHVVIGTAICVTTSLLALAAEHCQLFSMSDSYNGRYCPGNGMVIPHLLTHQCRYVSIASPTFKPTITMQLQEHVVVVVNFISDRQYKNKDNLLTKQNTTLVIAVRGYQRSPWAHRAGGLCMTYTFKALWLNVNLYVPPPPQFLWLLWFIWYISTACTPNHNKNHHNSSTQGYTQWRNSQQ